MSKHTHKYRRVNIGHNGKQYWVMKCVYPECTHYSPMATKLSAPLLRGRSAICNRCGNKFVLNKRALRMEQPCCDECVNVKKSPKLQEAEDFWSKLEKEANKV